MIKIYFQDKQNKAKHLVILEFYLNPMITFGHLMVKKELIFGYHVYAF